MLLSSRLFLALLDTIGHLWRGLLRPLSPFTSCLPSSQKKQLQKTSQFQWRPTCRVAFGTVLDEDFQALSGQAVSRGVAPCLFMEGLSGYLSVPPGAGTIQSACCLAQWTTLSLAAQETAFPWIGPVSG